MSSPYEEIYDPKGQRVSSRPRPSEWKMCEGCKCCGGHSYDCPATPLIPELAAWKINKLNEDLAAARAYAGKMLDQVRLMYGKLSMLKHENNKLRKANERLRNGQSK